MDKKKDSIKNRICRISFRGKFSEFKYNITASGNIIERIRNAIIKIEKDYVKEWEKNETKKAGEERNRSQ